MNVKELVLSEIRQALEKKGGSMAVLNESVEILSDTTLDSLDLAALLVSLEEKTGVDPFANGFVEFKTIGELTSLYQPSLACS